MKIIVNIRNENPALDKYENLDPATLAHALKFDINEKIVERRNELTDRLKARGIVPQLSFDFDIEVTQ